MQIISHFLEKGKGKETKACISVYINLQCAYVCVFACSCGYRQTKKKKQIEIVTILREKKTTLFI